MWFEIRDLSLDRIRQDFIYLRKEKKKKILLLLADVFGSDTSQQTGGRGVV